MIKDYKTFKIGFNFKLNLNNLNLVFQKKHNKIQHLKKNNKIQYLKKNNKIASLL